MPTWGSTGCDRGSGQSATICGEYKRLFRVFLERKLGEYGLLAKAISKPLLLDRSWVTKESASGVFAETSER